MGVLALFSVYIREMFFSLLAVFGMDISSGNHMKVFYVLVTGVCVATFVHQTVSKIQLSKKEMGLIFAFAILLVAFLFVPRIVYRGVPSAYQGAVLTAFSSVLSAFLMGVLARRGNLIHAMAGAVPWIVIFNTVSSFMVVFGTSDTNTGGYISDDSGFGYQGLSYFIAETYAMNIFYIKNQHNIKKNTTFSKGGWNTFFQCLIPLHMLMVMLAGGRGAFVLVCILSVYYFMMDSANVGKNIKNLILMTGFIIVVFVLASTSSLEYSGFDRIMSLLSGEGDGNRALLQDMAWWVFNKKPLTGNGTGSVFPILRTYSHNLFTDVLVEYGTIGLIVVVVIVYLAVKNLIRLVKSDSQHHLIVLIAMCCFTMAMFSGYYLTNAPLWFVVGFVFSTTPDEKPQIKKPVCKYVKIRR